MNDWSRKFLMTPKLGDHYGCFLKKKDNEKQNKKEEKTDNSDQHEKEDNPKKTKEG